jgi:hypothetical protein
MQIPPILQVLFAKMKDNPRIRAQFADQPRQKPPSPDFPFIFVGYKPILPSVLEDKHPVGRKPSIKGLTLCLLRVIYAVRMKEMRAASS